MEDSSSNPAYQPLTSQSEIRLLSLKQGLDNTAIECTLIHAITGERSYQALSYEWGLPEPDEPTINIGGFPQRIRKGLHAALSRIRKDKDLLVWIDALCINQQDIEERRSQVAMMGEIYRRAERVLVWLGPEDTDSRCAMQVFRRILVKVEREKVARRNLPRGFRKVTNEYRYENLVPVLRHSGNDNGMSSIGNHISVHEMRAVIAWASRSYWKRVWIIQEITLAKNLTIICGGESIDERELDEIHWEITLSFPLASFDMEIEGQQLVKRLWITMYKGTLAFPLLEARRMHGGVGVTLCEWIVKCQYSECMDPRDRVYAILGVACNVNTGDIEDAGSGYMEVDYEKSLVEVYCDVARFYAQETGKRITGSELRPLLRRRFHLGRNDMNRAKDEIEKAYILGKQLGEANQ